MVLAQSVKQGEGQNQGSSAVHEDPQPHGSNPISQTQSNLSLYQLTPEFLRTAPVIPALTANQPGTSTNQSTVTRVQSTEVQQDRTARNADNVVSQESANPGLLRRIGAAVKETLHVLQSESAVEAIGVPTACGIVGAAIGSVVPGAGTAAGFLVGQGVGTLALKARNLWRGREEISDALRTGESEVSDKDTAFDAVNTALDIASVALPALKLGVIGGRAAKGVQLAGMTTAGAAAVDGVATVLQSDATKEEKVKALWQVAKQFGTALLLGKVADGVSTRAVGAMAGRVSDAEVSVTHTENREPKKAESRGNEAPVTAPASHTTSQTQTEIRDGLQQEFAGLSQEAKERAASDPQAKRQLRYESRELARLAGEIEQFDLTKAGTAIDSKFPPPSEVPLSKWDPSEPHSMDIQRYAASRLSKTVLDRAIADGWKIEITSEAPLDTLRRLRAEGFTEAMRYRTMDGEYTKLIVSNPQTGETKLVLQTLPGESYRKQVEGSVMLYRDEHGRSASPENVRVLKHDVDLKRYYADVLEAYGVKPDIVILGNRGVTERRLGEMGIRPHQVVSDPLLGGTVYHYNTADGQSRTILSVNVSPQLFGDKMSSFTEAAIEAGARKIFFGGTSGGLDPQLRVGDVVFPRTVQQVGPRSADSGISDVSNVAFPNHPDMRVVTPNGEGVAPVNHRQVEKAGTVETPVVETEAFVRRARSEGVAAVECEAAHIASGITNSGHSEDVDFYYVLGITDLPGTSHSNADKSRKLDATYFGREDVRTYSQTILDFVEQEVQRSGFDPRLTAQAQDTPQRRSAAGTTSLDAGPLRYEIETSEGKSAILDLRLRDEGDVSVFELEGVKRTIDGYTRALAESGPLTREKRRQLDQFLQSISDVYGIRVDRKQVDIDGDVREAVNVAS